MDLWKKATALLLVAGMALALAACGPADSASSGSSLSDGAGSSSEDSNVQSPDSSSQEPDSAPDEPDETGSSLPAEPSDTSESSPSDAPEDVSSESESDGGDKIFTDIPKADIDVPFSIDLGDIATQDIDGNDFSGSYFSQYDLTMINLWATWCGPCISELPSLGKLAEKYAEQGVGLVGLLADEDYSGARALLDNAEAGYPCITMQDDALIALTGTTQYVPTTLFVDSEGKIVGGYFVGARSEDDWSRIIDQYLAGLQS